MRLLRAAQLPALALALAAALGSPGAALACSVCLAGDPSFTTHGTSTLESGSVALYLELRGWDKRSGNAPVGAAPAEPATPGSRGGGGHAGHHHGEDLADEPIASEEEARSQRLDLYVAWTPLDRLTLTLDLPWAFNGIEEIGDDGRTSTSLSGFGDLSLAASGVLWRNRDVLPSTWVEGRLWGKAPTGRDEQRVEGERNPHLQTGTGSWDFGFGGAVVHRVAWASLYGSAFYRMNTEGALDYEYGDVALATLAIEAPVGHALGRESLRWLVPGLALDLRWAARDRDGGASYDDSGGTIPYLTPSLRIALPGFGEGRRAWLRTGVQVPLTNRWLYGAQDEGPVWSVGVGLGL
jgi:hypothetical protein